MPDPISSLVMTFAGSKKTRPTMIVIPSLLHIDPGELRHVARDERAIPDLLEREEMRRAAMLHPRVFVVVHLVEHPPGWIVFALQDVEAMAARIALDRSRRVVEDGRFELAEQLRLHLYLHEHDEHGRTILRAWLTPSASSDLVSWVARWRPTF